VSDGIAGRQVVGIDLHLHRSVIARIDDQGNELGWVRIDNDPKELRAQCRKAGRGVPVAIEATYGWSWAVDALLAAGFEVHLAHPLGIQSLVAVAGRTRGTVAAGALELPCAEAVEGSRPAPRRAVRQLLRCCRPAYGGLARSTVGAGRPQHSRRPKPIGSASPERTCDQRRPQVLCRE
jgi:transposase